MSHRIGRREPVGKALRRLVADDLNAAQADLRGNGSAEERIHRVRQRLKRLRTLLRVLKPALPGEVAATTRALARSYRKGRHAMAQAQSSVSTPDLHRWRKAVKDYWNLLRLGRKRLPRAVRSSAGDLAHLGELLGLDHDHAVLAERLALSPDP